MIIGHQQAQDIFFTTRPLRHHAFLLHGIEGVGKSHFSWEVAAHLLETHIDNLRTGLNPDFRYLTAESGKRISIEATRIAISDLLMTAMNKNRILLIDPADFLGNEAANALLKFLEEPPSDSYVLLVSTSPKKLPITIRSRLLPILFSRLSCDEERSVFTHLGITADILAQNRTLANLCLGQPGLFAKLYRQECNLYLQSLEQMLAKLPDANWDDLHALTQTSPEQFYCFSYYMANFFTHLASKKPQFYQSLQTIPLAKILKTWEKAHHYISMANLPVGMGISANQAAHFILHSLLFLSRKYS